MSLGGLIMTLTDWCLVPHCRGVASIPPGFNLPLDTIRQVWGQGVRAGLYPITPNQLYWFTCFNAPEVSHRQLGLDLVSIIT